METPVSTMCSIKTFKNTTIIVCVLLVIFAYTFLLYESDYILCVINAEIQIMLIRS